MEAGNTADFHSGCNMILQQPAFIILINESRRKTELIKLRVLEWM
jgi:hypothetical protein